MVSHRILLVTSLVCVVGRVVGTGFMSDPPARGSMWKVGYDTPKDYNHMSINCGGIHRQWIQNEGECGVCGDPADGARLHEAGGVFATGLISRTYKQGGIIPIRVNLTASHGGWFEFRICPNNDVTNTRPATPDCFQKLRDAAGNDRFTDVPPGGMHTSIVMEYRLPAGLTCQQCVLQWLYNTGKDWGCDTTGQCGTGLGRQEQFVGCSDIAITFDGQPFRGSNGGTTRDGNGGTTKDPNGGTTKDPNGGTTKDPNGGTTKDPNGGTTKDPNGGTTKDPNGGTTKDPNGGTTKDPNGGTTKDPNGGTTTDPNRRTTTDPNGGTTKDPNQGTTTRIPPVSREECASKGVLKGVYDEFCRNACVTETSCPVAFCDDQCLERARQLDRCNSTNSCPLK